MFKSSLPFIALLVFFNAIQVLSPAQTIVNKDNKFGLMDTDGSSILAMEFADIHELLLYDNYKTDLFLYKKDKMYGLYNGKTKLNTGLVLDSIVQGHYKGTYAFRSGKLWGMVIEPELYRFDWVMPKYAEIAQWSDGISPFIPDPYSFDYNFKGFSVRNDSLWGYASYKEDKLLIPMKYRNRIEKSHDSQGTYYVSRDYKKGGGYIIHRETFASIEVSDVVMADRFGDYFVDSYFIGDIQYTRIQHLPTGTKSLDVEAKDFEHSNIRFKMITANIIEFNGEAKRKNENKEEDPLHIWYNLKTGEEVCDSRQQIAANHI